jgi:hypothetical protein
MEFITEKLEQIAVLVGEIQNYVGENYAEEGETQEEVQGNFVEIEGVDVNLDEMSVKDLKALAKTYGIELTATKKDGIVEEMMSVFMGGEEPEEEEEEPEEGEGEEEEEEDIATKYGLNDMEIEQLAEILSSYGLSVKGKKQALIDRIVAGIEEGTIEIDGEEEQQEEDAGEAGEEDDSPRGVAESEVEADIRTNVASGNLKIVKIKEFLKDYNSGDPDCQNGCVNCSKDDQIGCYVGIHKNLVDDQGEVNEMGTLYIRDEEPFCCGKAIEVIASRGKGKKESYVCQICGTEYQPE